VKSAARRLEPSEIDASYRAYGASVLRRARRLLGNEDEAREVLHEVFMSLLESPKQVRGTGPLVAWLYGATTHASLNRLRNQRTRARLVAADNATRAAGAPPSAERDAIVRDLLARVPEELAKVAAYYYADEMTQEEIAAALDCSRRHVGDLIERLHQSVRALVSPSPQEVEP
jgi:RNA polymerase sigma factor (sigma-70 family)